MIISKHQMESTPDIPAEARKYFDETATALISTLRPCKPRKVTGPLRGSLGERPVAFNFDPSNILGPVEVTFTNGFDEFCGFEVHGQNIHEAITGEDAQKLEKLADTVARRRELKSLCGNAYVRAHLIRWIKHRRLGEEASISWTDSFLSALRTDVVDHVLKVPLEGIEIAAPFDLGGIHFDYFSKKQFDDT